MRIESTPRGVLTAFFRQKYRFLLSFLLVVAAVAAYLYLATPYYMSQGTMLVRFGASAHPDVSMATTPTAPNAISEDEQHAQIASYVQLMMSHDLLLPLVKKFGAEQLYPGIVETMHGDTQRAEEAAVSRLVKRDLVIKADTQSPIITIQTFNPSPELAQEFVSELMNVFTARQQQLFEDPQVGFLEGEVKRSGDELAARQNELAEFKRREGLTNIEAEMDALIQEKSDVKTAVVGQITDAQTTLDELRARQAELLATYQAGSFAARRMATDVALAERRLQQRRADLQALSAEDNSGGTPPTAHGNAANSPFAAHIADINNHMAKLESQRTQYTDLARAAQVAEIDYKNYLSHLEEARAAQTMKRDNITRITILDQPLAASVPSKPRTLLVAALGILAGLLLGFAIAIASETLDDRFTNPEQLSMSLRLPVMATFGKARRAYR